ncbi:MAG: DUF4738 domain-containing protein [Bacteroidaceae bacterium]|nr:DUF4738 domain-containing protein [Bacteroidaceae bacterium]
MKNAKLLLVGMVLTLLAACGNKENKSDAWVAPVHEVVVREMPTLHVTDSVRMGTHLYVYDILRQACDSLPKVQDDMDDLYRDNTIHLTLRRDGQAYFSKTFTKAVFSNSIDANFYQGAILDGIRFLRVESGQGLVFSIAVSFPDSDMSRPFLMTVADDGSYSYVKDDNLDYEDGDSTSYGSDEGV